MHQGTALAVCLVVAMGTTMVSGNWWLPQCNHLHAAFTYKDHHYFLYGNGQLAEVTFEGKIASETTYQAIGWPNVITAAAQAPWYHLTYFYSGKQEQPFREFGHPEYAPQFYVATHAPSIAQLIAHNPHTSIDAAFAGPQHHLVYFIGCNYYVVDAIYLKVLIEGSIHNLGMPCDVDAAWTSQDRRTAYITKGSQLYIWKESETHAKPASLLQEFPFLSKFNICP